MVARPEEETKKKKKKKKKKKDRPQWGRSNNNGGGGGAAVLLEYASFTTSITTNNTLDNICELGSFDFGFDSPIGFAKIDGRSKWVYEDPATGTEYVKSVHVGGTRCVTSSTDNIMKIHVRITLTVEVIRTCIFLF